MIASLFILHGALCVSEGQITFEFDENDFFVAKGGLLFTVIVPGFY